MGFCAGAWDPALYKSRSSMDSDWGQLGERERELQMVGFSASMRANAASAVSVQDRASSSYMYIMPPESSTGADAPEVCTRSPSWGRCMLELAVQA
jgi:hypothetical protein